MPSEDGKRLKEQILESAEKVEEDKFGENDWALVSDDIHPYFVLCICRIACDVIINRAVDIIFLQVMLIDPSQFKVLTEVLQKEVKGRGRMETIQQTVTGEA